MKNNDKLGKNLEKLISLHGEEQKMDAEQKNRIVENLTKNTQTQIPVTTHFWRKIAIAAIIIFVPVILAIYLHTPSEQKIKIPPELASMSVEELVKLNYDSSQTAFDPNIVKYALKQALEKTSPEKVIQIAKSLDDGGMDMQASMVAPPVHPIEHLGYASKTFEEVIEQSNLFIHANLIDVHINVDDIIAALVEKEMYKNFEHYVSRYRVSIELLVIDSLPENFLNKGEKIILKTILFEDKLNLLKKNAGYYFCMNQDKNNELHFLEYFSGVYSVDYNKPANIEIWQFVRDAQDILLYGQNPKSETIEYWVSKLQGDTYLLALEYMNILSDDLLPAESIVGSLEQGYNDYILFAMTSEEKMSNTNDEEERRKTSNEVYNKKHNTIALFEKTMLLLERSGDKDSIKRMLALVDEDTSSIDRSIVIVQNNFNRGFLPLIIRMTIVSNERDLGERLVETYYKYKDRPFTDTNNDNEYLASLRRTLQSYFERSFTTEIINQLKSSPLKYTQSFFLSVLEDPSAFEIYDASSLKMVWDALSSSEDFDMRSYLEKFITNPNLSDIGIKSPPDSTTNIPSSLSSSLYDYEQAAFEVLSSLTGSKAPDDDELLNFLLIIYERNKDNKKCINYTIDKLEEILQLSDTECSLILDKINIDDKPHWSITDIMSMYTPAPISIPKKDSIQINNNDESDIKIIEALYSSGQENEAVTKALEIFNEPFREDTTRNLLYDLRSKVDLVLFLGKTQKPELDSQIDQYTREENIGKYRNYSGNLEGRVIGYTVENLLQNSIMALARLGEKSSVSRVREIYNTTDNIRAKIIAAIGLYYNGDNTGEKLLRHFVEGTHHNLPEIEMRWGVDLSDGKVFQQIIDSYLRNELTDALWLEKMSYYLDRADTKIDNDFFKEHRKEILEIAAGHLNNKNKDIRGYAVEILQKATAQNFGFDNNRYAGQQEEKIQRWREYLKSYEE